MYGSGVPTRRYCRSSFSYLVLSDRRTVGKEKFRSMKNCERWVIDEKRMCASRLRLMYVSYARVRAREQAAEVNNRLAAGSWQSGSLLAESMIEIGIRNFM